jgi:Protein of unknown function (DUF3019)
MPLGRADGARAIACLLVALSGLCVPGFAASAVPGDEVKLQISPRICVLTDKDRQCEIPVHAQWKSTHEESLCLVIVTHPDVKRCWEHFSAGTYTVELTFTDDLTFQLQDVSMQRVLASEVLQVIREAIRYRHKRRQPWSIFE